MAKRYIEFKIQTSENMQKERVVMFMHPDHRAMISKLLEKLERQLKEKQDE